MAKLLSLIRNLSVKAQLIGSITGLVALIVLFAVSYFPQQHKKASFAGFEDKVAKLTTIMASSVSAGLEFDDAVSVREHLSSLHGDGDLRFARASRKDSSVLASYFRSEENEILLDRQASNTTTVYREGNYLIGLAPILSNEGQSLGSLQMGFSLDRLNAEIVQERWVTLFVCFIILAVGTGISFFIARLYTAPFRRAQGVLEMVATGNFSHSLTVSSDNEVGKMMRALDKTISELRHSIHAIGENARFLSNFSEDLTSVSQKMNSNAENTSSQAYNVSSSAEQVSKSIQTVATGIEELGASIKEIANNAHEAANVALSAVRLSSTANASVSKLGESSESIGKVIKVITGIAEQTNLLALNATIEAARAGSAGRGFAVVANEVKELAKETARATDDISQKIQTIQSDTGEAVDSIGRITSTINQINDIQNMIASAVEEQTATTGEISRNISEAAKGSSEIASSIVNVAKMSKETTTDSEETQKASTELSQIAGQLKKLVGRFVTD